MLAPLGEDDRLTDRAWPACRQVSSSRKRAVSRGLHPGAVCVAKPHNRRTAACGRARAMFALRNMRGKGPTVLESECVATSHRRRCDAWSTAEGASYDERESAGHGRAGRARDRWVSKLPHKLARWLFPRRLLAAKHRAREAKTT